MKKLLFLILFPVCLFAQHGTQSILKRVQIKQVYHAYGGFQDSSTTVAVSSGAWTQFTNTDWGVNSNTLFGGVEADGFSLVKDSMIVSFSGDITGVVSLTIASSNNKEYDFRIYNATQDAQAGFSIGAVMDGNNNSSVSFPVYIEATANDTLVLQVYGVTDGTDITAKHGMFYLQYLHD